MTKPCRVVTFFGVVGPSHPGHSHMKWPDAWQAPMDVACHPMEEPVPVGVVWDPTPWGVTLDGKYTKHHGAMRWGSLVQSVCLRMPNSRQWAGALAQVGIR